MTKQEFLTRLKRAADYNGEIPKEYEDRERYGVYWYMGAGYGCYRDANLNRDIVRYPMYQSKFVYRITTRAKKYNAPFIIGRFIYRSYAIIETYYFSISCGSSYERYLADIGRIATAGETSLSIKSEKTGRAYVVPYSEIDLIDTVSVQANQMPQALSPLGLQRYYPDDLFGLVGTSTLAGIDLTNAITLPLGQVVYLE